MLVGSDFKCSASFRTRVHCDESFISGLTALIDALVARGTIVDLEVGNNAVSDAGAAALANAVTQLPSLTALEVHENKFGDEGAKSFAAMLQVS